MRHTLSAIRSHCPCVFHLAICPEAAPRREKIFFENLKKTVDKSCPIWYDLSCAEGNNIKIQRQGTASGGIAQLGERLNGIQEVSGSIPLISTRTEKSLGTSASKAFSLENTSSSGFGPVAQLGERSVRIREVESSNLFRSTRWTLDEHLLF